MDRWFIKITLAARGLNYDNFYNLTENSTLGKHKLQLQLRYTGYKQWLIIKLTLKRLSIKIIRNQII